MHSALDKAYVTKIALTRVEVAGLLDEAGEEATETGDRYRFA